MAVCGNSWSHCLYPPLPFKLPPIFNHFNHPQLHHSTFTFQVQHLTGECSLTVTSTLPNIPLRDTTGQSTYFQLILVTFLQQNLPNFLGRVHTFLYYHGASAGSRIARVGNRLNAFNGLFFVIIFLSGLALLFDFLLFLASKAFNRFVSSSHNNKPQPVLNSR